MADGNAPGHILIVEPDGDGRDALARRLRGLGHRVSEAGDGLAGVACARAETPDLVLVGARLPRLSGPEAVRRLRADPATAGMPVLMLVPCGDGAALAEGVRAGAADGVAWPCADEELAARVRAQLEIGILRREIEAVRTRVARHESESGEALRCAARIQQSLLRERLPQVPGLAFAARYLPYVAASGDYYDLFRLDERTMGLFIADASGRGVPAAMLSVFVKMTLERSAKRIGADSYALVPPDELLSVLNERLLETGLQDEFITAFYAHYDLGTRRLVYASGAHPPPILVRGPGAARAEELPGEGMLIGIFRGARFDPYAVDLAPGDRFFLYTDGLLEAQNGKGELCGAGPLLEAAHAARTRKLDEAADAVVSAARSHAGGRSFEDDVSVVAVEVTGP